MKSFSTNQVAKLAGIHRATMLRWIEDGKVKASTEVPIDGGRVLRRWSEADLKKVKEFKAQFYSLKPSQVERLKKK